MGSNDFAGILERAGLRAAGVYPVLAGDEQRLADARVGAEVVVLTSRRIVVSSALREQSMPLAHVARTSVGFERAAGGFVQALILLVVAIAIAVAAGPTRDFVVRQAASLESAVQQNAAEPAAAGPGVATGLQRGLNALARVDRVLVALAWLVGLAALVRCAVTVWGRTHAVVASAAGEIALQRRGRDDALVALIQELGRRLPAAG
jgi:hypothetical protein